MEPSFEFPSLLINPNWDKQQGANFFLFFARTSLCMSIFFEYLLLLLKVFMSQI